MKRSSIDNKRLGRKSASVLKRSFVHPVKLCTDKTTLNILTFAIFAPLSSYGNPYEMNENGKTGKIIISTDIPYSDKFKILKILNSIPIEYRKIEGYDWFTGNRYN